MNGIIVIDKPQDYTSFDVVAVMRRLCSQKKIGHTGTLDPMATGVLPLLLGTATRAQSFIPDTDKEYIAQFQLGVTTDTQDSTGKVLQTRSFSAVTRQSAEQALCPLRGAIMQIPPMYSAVQKDGVRLYDLARQGIEIERQPRPVTIYTLELTEFNEAAGTGALRVSCSKGTYIRTLCADIGESLGCGAVMRSLRRTAACNFTLHDSITLDEARALAETDRLKEKVRPVEGVFAQYAAVTVTDAQSVRFQNGAGLLLNRTDVPAGSSDGTVFRVKARSGCFLGLGVVSAEKQELSVLKLFCTKGE